MKYRLSSIITMFILISCLIGNYAIPFNKSESNSSKSPVEDIQPDWVNWRSNGGYSIGNVIVTDNSSIYMCLISPNQYITEIVKYDLYGNLIWNNSWNGNGNLALGLSMALDSSNIFILGAQEIGGQNGFFLLNFNSTGNLLWNVSWLGNDTISPQKIIIYMSDIYILANIFLHGDIQSNICLLKYNMTGALIWNRTVDFTNNMMASSIAIYNSTIFISGMNLMNTSKFCPFIIQCDLDSNILSEKTDEKVLSDFLFSNILFVDKTGLYLAGTYININSYIYVNKYDNQSNDIWNKSYDLLLNTTAKSMTIVNSTIYIVGSYQNMSTSKDVFLLAYEVNGTLLWVKRWGGSWDDEAYSITSDNWNLFISGYSDNYTTNLTNGFLLKTDLTGNEHPDIIPVAEIDSISPSITIQGTNITFIGHGNDIDGTVVGYCWTSNINGVLNNNSTFNISTLTIGDHTISFKAQDNRGFWSEEVREDIKILPRPQNIQPIAIIDLVEPIESTYHQSVIFVGHGYDPDGIVTNYCWSSSLDGLLSENVSFISNNISIGHHIISFSVKDDNNTWSVPVYVGITINGSGSDKLIIKVISTPIMGESFSVKIMNSTGHFITGALITLWIDNNAYTCQSSNSDGDGKIHLPKQSTNLYANITASKYGYRDSDNMTIKLYKNNINQSRKDFTSFIIFLPTLVVIVISLV